MKNIVLLFFVIGLSLIPLSEHALAQSQTQPINSEELTVLLGGAALGAMAGGLVGGFFDFVYAWGSSCSGLLSWQELEKRYEFWEVQGRLAGPAIGATAAVIMVSQFYQLKGDAGFSLLSSLGGVYVGVLTGCALEMYTEGLPILRSVAVGIPIATAAIFAIWGYDPKDTHTSHREARSAPGIHAILWDLRF
jgi:hypothetical protein